jgi:hypothetical protein
MPEIGIAATFSPKLADITIYVIDLSAGDKIPRKGGPGRDGRNRRFRLAGRWPRVSDALLIRRTKNFVDRRPVPADVSR